MNQSAKTHSAENPSLHAWSWACTIKGFSIQGRFLLFALVLALAIAGCNADASPALIDLTFGEVTIERLEIQVLPGDPPETRVVAHGNLGDNCTLIAQANVEQKDNMFTLSLSTETTGESECVEGVFPFEQVISLPVSDLPPGTYEVVLANLRQSFDILEISAEVAEQATPAPTEQAEEPIEATAAETETAATTENTPTDPAPTARGSLTGLVWHDRCGVAATDPTATAGNCVETTAGFSANGILEAGEAGLGSVDLQLGSGACPASGLATTLTDGNGNFAFPDLETGTYCVTINADSPPNDAVLLPGTWTAPAPGTNRVTIDIRAGEETTVNFGWDFAQLPFVEEPTCIDKAAFYEDITIPDNTVIRPGATFLKTWKLRNEGTCTWGPDYSVILADGDPLGAPILSPLFPIRPGEIFEFSLEMTAPNDPGEYVANYQFRNANGTDFGVGVKGTDFFWTLIAVSWFPEPGKLPEMPAPEPPPTQPSPSSSPGACAVDFDSGFESQVLTLINNARAAQGLSALQSQNQLTAAARAHSTDMACNDFVGHDGTDGSSWFDRVAAQGYSYSSASENIYVGNPAFGGTPAGAFEWWMNSEVHRNNILNPGVSQIGVGYVFRSGSTYGGYYTLVFASP